MADNDSKGIAALPLAAGNELIIVGNNSDRVRAYLSKTTKKYYYPEKGDAYALLTMKDGSIYKHEFYYGSTYLSQSSRAMPIPKDVISVKVFDFQGKSRDINPESESASK